MNKYLLLADTHLGIRASSDAWHDIVINLFKEIRDVCIREEIGTILHLGDFFHERKATNTKTLDVAQQIEKILFGLNMYIIVGNHDIFYKSLLNPTSLQIFKDSPAIKVIDTTTIIGDNCTLVPWGLMPDSSGGGYCFGHFPIKTFYMNNSRICNKGFSPQVFKGFEHTYSGHFHTPSNDGNITYLGSPYAQTFHDINSKRGYYIFDNGHLEFIEYTSAPKFVKIKSEDGFLPDDIKGNIVKLIFTKDHGTTINEKIVNIVNSFNPFSLSVDFSESSGEEVKGDSEGISLLSNLDILKEYSKKYKHPENIKKKILEEIIENMVKEIEEE